MTAAALIVAACIVVVVLAALSCGRREDEALGITEGRADG